LQALGLLPWLSGLLTPDLTGAAKHERSFYGSWPAGAGLCVMAGDVYQDDVVPAHSFGFRTAWKVPELGSLDHLDPFDRPAAYPFGPGRPIHPDAIIISLAELPAVVERLEHATGDVS
jgi:FMN phosphatase YigB (HAD superfamily)